LRRLIQDSGPRRLFPNDMEKQQLKLMDTIAAIVGTLDQRELFQPSSVIQDPSTPTLEYKLVFYCLW